MSDVCSSDLIWRQQDRPAHHHRRNEEGNEARPRRHPVGPLRQGLRARQPGRPARAEGQPQGRRRASARKDRRRTARDDAVDRQEPRSEEHTSELQSLMRISYAVFCLKKKNKKRDRTNTDTTKKT